MNKTILSLCVLASVSLTAQTNAPATKSAPKKPAATAVKPTGTKLVETVSKVGKEIVIPYKKFILPNGLTVVVHEDHSDPIAYVDVTYHVGSNREQQGRSGFAHFFEHMMFQGSKNVADEQHFKIITEAGGTLNGSTNSDRTNYFETVPSNQLEKMLWLEADRMGFLLDSVTQTKFEVQRATVKNERGQNYDNRPYGLVGEKTGEALFPKGHPYSWTTIGYIEDLNRVDVNDLKRFYMRWYGPNNAVLTVAGDVTTADVVKLAEKYFGSIPRGPEVKNMTKQPAVLTENRYISYEDNVRFPMYKVTYPTVASMDKDEVALDVLGQILSNSKSSPLYNAFIKSQKAVSAGAYNYSRELSGQFEIMIRANAGTKLSDIETLLNQTLAEWEKTGATDDDIKKYKVSYESNLYDGLSTVQGKGKQLAAYQTYANNPNYLKTEMANNLKVTKADVMRVYNTYIKGKYAVILSCVPKGKTDLIAKADTWKMYERTIEQESAEYKNLSYTEPKDNFVRRTVPAAQTAKLVPLPNYWTSNYTNGIKAIGINSNDIPKVDIQFSMPIGHRYEPFNKSGLAVMLASLLEESTQKHSAEEIGNKLERLGSEVSFYATDNEIVMTISALKQNLDSTACFDMACVLTADDPIYDAESHPLQLGIELLLVDEGHDLNRAMFTVLEALALRNPLRQLYVVGDVDQVVHSDSGADAGFMGDEFTRAIGPARTLRLDTGHRFGAALADALGRHAAKPYAVAPDKHTDIEILKVANPKALAGLIDGAFRRAAAGGKAPSLAVLLRHPGAAVQLENALALKGYSTETYGFEPFARRAEILFLRSLVAWATDRLDSLANAPLAQVVQALAEFSGCMSDPQVKDRLRRSGPGSARFDNLGALREHVLGDVQQFPARGSERDRSAILNFADGAAMAAMRRFVEGVRGGIAPGELERLVHSSGVAGLARRAFVFDEQVDDAIASMSDFARSAAEFDRLDAWLEQMAARDADASRGKARGAQVLRLYSIAAAKGLEFDHVVLPGVDAGRFDAGEQEERNLFYVAASRARKKLSISFGQRPSALLAAFGREGDWGSLA